MVTHAKKKVCTTQICRSHIEGVSILSTESFLLRKWLKIGQFDEKWMIRWEVAFEVDPVNKNPKVEFIEII